MASTAFLKLARILTTGAVIFLIGAWPVSAKVEHMFVDHLLKNNASMDELQNRGLFDEMMRLLFEEGAFESLEYAALQLREQKLRTHSGLNKLNSFYDAIDKIVFLNPEEESKRPELERAVQTWLEQYPKSTTAHLAHAQMLLQHAWSFRGYGYSHEVPAEKWAPFFECVEKARQYLQDNEAYRNDDPRWDMMLVNIAKLQDLPDQKFAEIVDTALKRNPDYYQLYFDAMDRYLPEWQGSVDAVEKFARQAVEYSKAADGHGLYARVYWYASQSQFQERLFSQSSVRWDDMKLGIDDVLAQYPDKWNIYNFAMFSCFAEDEKKSAELFSKFSVQDIPPSWPYYNNFQHCREAAGLL